MRMLILPFILNDIVPRIKISSIVYLLISHYGNHCLWILVWLPGNHLSYSYWAQTELAYLTTSVPVIFIFLATKDWTTNNPPTFFSLNARGSKLIWLKVFGKQSRVILQFFQWPNHVDLFPTGFQTVLRNGINIQTASVVIWSQTGVFQCWSSTSIHSWVSEKSVTQGFLEREEKVCGKLLGTGINSGISCWGQSGGRNHSNLNRVF